MTTQLPKVTITTDGGCWPNPGPGAWAAILRHGASVKTVCGANGKTTNNRMELTAIIEALRCLKTRAAVTLRTDSMYCIYALAAYNSKRSREYYMKKRQNPDLVAELWTEAAKHDVTPIWVRGHSGDADNEAADRICTETMRKTP